MSVKMLVKLSTLQESTDNVSQLWTKFLFILHSQVIQRLLWVINQCSAPYTYHKSWFSKPRELRCGVNHVHAIARPLSMKFQQISADMVIKWCKYSNFFSTPVGWSRSWLCRWQHDSHSLFVQTRSRPPVVKATLYPTPVHLPAGWLTAPFSCDSRMIRLTLWTSQSLVAIGQGVIVNV